MLGQQPAAPTDVVSLASQVTSEGIKAFIGLFTKKDKPNPDDWKGWNELDKQIGAPEGTNCINWIINDGDSVQNEASNVQSYILEFGLDNILKYSPWFKRTITKEDIQDKLVRAGFAAPKQDIVAPDLTSSFFANANKNGGILGNLGLPNYQAETVTKATFDWKPLAIITLIASLFYAAKKLFKGRKKYTWFLIVAIIPFMGISQASNNARTFKQVQPDWNALSGYGKILNKPDLSLYALRSGAIFTGTVFSPNLYGTTVFSNTYRSDNGSGLISYSYPVIHIGSGNVSDYVNIWTAAQKRVIISTDGSLTLGSIPSSGVGTFYAGNISANDYIFGNGKLAIRTTDNYLRLNQNGDFTLTYTPYDLRTDANLIANAIVKSGSSSNDCLMGDGSTIKLQEGTYTPTITNFANTSSLTATNAFYTKIGSKYHVSLLVTLTPSVIGSCSFFLTIPTTINSSTQRCSGTLSGGQGEHGRVVYNSTTNVLVSFVSSFSGVPCTYSVNFDYSEV